MRTMNDRVEAVLEQAGCPYAIHYHKDIKTPIRGPADFAAALGTTQERITKTLFLAERTAERRHALLCCSSTARIDFKEVASALNYGRMEVANPEELAGALGYPRNGVSPLGATPNIPVLLDEILLTFPSILIGAGQTAIEIELAPHDLKCLTNAIVGRFTKE